MFTAVWLTLVVPNQAMSLADIQKLVSDNAKAPTERRLTPEELNEKLYSLIDSDTLRSPQEFDQASDLVQFDYANYFEMTEVQYELTYTAVALGSQPARAKLAGRWDQLTMTLGRYRTLGKEHVGKQWANDGYWPIHAAPKRVVDIFLHPESAKPAQTDNAEVAQMFKDDQEVRSGEMDQKAMKKMMEEDPKRLARIKVMTAQNMLGTAIDFRKAAFLFQHGDRFEDFFLAHELSVCSVLLGEPKAAWIGAASYDRMLNSCGHHQRWGTQFRSSGTKTVLAKCDEKGMSEFQRKTITGFTLEESRHRKM